MGRGLDAWEVIATVRDNEGSQAAADYWGLPLGFVRAAVAYYGDFHSEIDDEISRNDAEYVDGMAAARAGERSVRA